MFYTPKLKVAKDLLCNCVKSSVLTFVVWVAFNNAGQKSKPFSIYPSVMCMQKFQPNFNPIFISVFVK